MMNSPRVKKNLNGCMQNPVSTSYYQQPPPPKLKYLQDESYTVYNISEARRGKCPQEKCLETKD